MSVGGINIKNIGIVHNREYERGTLSIEFYDAAAQERAVRILTAHGYPEVQGT